jgi:hypothetical protein
VEARNSYRILAGSRLGKRTLGRKRMEYEINIKTDPTEVGCVDATGSGSYSMADFVISGVEPSGSVTTELGGYYVVIKIHMKG